MVHAGDGEAGFAHARPEELGVGLELGARLRRRAEHLEDRLGRPDQRRRQRVGEQVRAGSLAEHRHHRRGSGGVPGTKQGGEGWGV